jgi:hypothetical protein
MYTFLFVSPNGSIPVFEFAACADDEAARQEAERLLDRQHERRTVEVWNERERIWVVRRKAGDASTGGGDQLL